MIDWPFEAYSSGANLNRPQTEEARWSIRPAYHGLPVKLQHCHRIRNAATGGTSETWNREVNTLRRWNNISLTISTPVLSWGDMTLVRSTELFPYPFGVFPLLLSMTPKVVGNCRSNARQLGVSRGCCCSQANLGGKPSVICATDPASRL